MNPLALLFALAMTGLYDTPKPLAHRKVSPVIKAFNAFQLVASFAGLPFLAGWLHTDPFPFSVAAFWASIAAYVVLFIMLTFFVYDSIDGK